MSLCSRVGTKLEHASDLLVDRSVQRERRGQHEFFLRWYCYGSSAMWKAVIDEAHEIAWLATVVGALSVAGVGVAVMLAGG